MKFKKTILGMCLVLASSAGLAVIALAGELKKQLTPQESFSPVSPHYFTVRDSIEVARFGRVGYEPTVSPDGKYFALVTSRGIVESNQTESTLWVFRANTVKEYLGSSDTAAGLAPKIVARLAAIPKAEYQTSYEPIISNIRWAPDSKQLLFLAQNSDGTHRLYRTDVKSGFISRLTPRNQDVRQFDFAGGTVVYRVKQFEKSRAGDRINADARDVTAMPLESILFPNKRIPSNYSTLWINQDNRNKPVLDSRTAHPVRLWDLLAVNLNVLEISPDGNSAVTLLPVKEVAQSWERYEPHLAPKIRAQDQKTTADTNPFRLTQYAVIDLKKGQSRALVNAPNGWTLGYSDRNRAIWSSDGKKILLTNTFLPFDGVDDSEQPKRVRPCAAAVVDLPTSSTRCVFYHEAKERVRASSFGQTDEEVVLWFSNDTAGKRFHFRNDVWQPEVDLTGRDQTLPAECVGSRVNLLEGLSIQVEQDLNAPPVLSATDCRTKRHKKIWNPNPQLATMTLGEASVIHWNDASGYEWTGALLKPPDYVPGKRYPLVIQCYGFKEGEFLTDGQDTTAFAARPLAAAGMVVLLFWYRPDHLGTAEEAHDQALGFQSAIEQLTSEGLVDPDRVGIIGFSRTCYHVESALIENPLTFAAATIADGVDYSYLQHHLFYDADRADQEEKIYGARPFGEGLRRWVDHAPGFHLDRVQTPLRIEALNPYSILTEWEIYTSLLEQKKPVDLIYIQDGQHILQKPLDRVASQQGNVDWFRFWLKGEEDPDPAKTEQYARWRELRKLQDKNKAAGDKSLGPMN